MLPRRLPSIEGRRPEAEGTPAVTVHDHEALDEVLTILAMAASAGVRPREAIGIVGRVGSGSLAAAIRPCAERIERGSPLPTALRAARTTDRRIQRLHRILERAELDGTSYVAAIETLRDDVRTERFTEMEVAAQRLSVAIQFPLVLCILPSFIVLALVPLVLALVGDLAI